MIGLGTIINTAAILVGGVAGRLFGKHFPDRLQETLCKTCGVSVIFVGIAGAMSGMLSLKDGELTAGKSMLVVLCLVFGALIGEIINFEDRFERFGEWLKKKTGNAKDGNFVNGFVTVSLTVCIGAMAVVGSIQDGISGDFSILATKSVLDFIIVMVMTSSLGIGCIFSALPVAVFEGLMTLLATFIKPLMTQGALFNLSMVGSILIFCVGVNLVWGKKVRVANLLPSIILAVAVSFIPFEF